MALKQRLRLRKNSDFQRVRQQGRSVSSRLLILAWAPTNQDTGPSTGGTPRIGFVVSKRVSRLAVQRNHVKRLLCEAMRPWIPVLPAGIDVVISSRQQALLASDQALRDDIAFLLRRARLPGQPQEEPRDAPQNKGRQP